MQYARDNDFVVFTHDLDFGAILAATRANTPSVLQIRGQDVMPDTLEVAVTEALVHFSTELDSGALVTVDIVRARVRILPV
jgi:predicted nuclease of predicted toxin-antitoxin system